MQYIPGIYLRQFSPHVHGILYTRQRPLGSPHKLLATAPQSLPHFPPWPPVKCLLAHLKPVNTRPLHPNSKRLIQTPLASTPHNTKQSVLAVKYLPQHPHDSFESEHLIQSCHVLIAALRNCEFQFHELKWI